MARPAISTVCNHLMTFDLSSPPLQHTHIHTQAAMWFNFLFLFILTVIFIVRMVLYLRRQVRGSAVLHNASKEEYDPILENKDSAMTRPVSRTV